MSRIRWMTRSIVASSLLILVLAACTPQAETAGVSRTEATVSQVGERVEDGDPTPIRIGALVPLSAPGSVVGGEAMRAAMIIAADEINAGGGLLGRPVELIVVDSEGLPERGTAGAERLINQDRVVAIAGGYHSSVGVAAKEVAHDNGIPIRFCQHVERHHHQRSVSRSLSHRAAKLRSFGC